MNSKLSVCNVSLIAVLKTKLELSLEAQDSIQTLGRVVGLAVLVYTPSNIPRSTCIPRVGVVYPGALVIQVVYPVYYTV